MATLAPPVATAASAANVVTHAFIGFPLYEMCRRPHVMFLQIAQTIALFVFSFCSHAVQMMNIRRNMAVHAAFLAADMNQAQFAFPMAALDAVKMPYKLRACLHVAWYILHTFLRVSNLEPLVSVYVSAGVFVVLGVLIAAGVVETRVVHWRMALASVIILAGALVLWYLDDPIMTYETHAGWHITVWTAQGLYYRSMGPTLDAEEAAFSSWFPDI